MIGQEKKHGGGALRSTVLLAALSVLFAFGCADESDDEDTHVPAPDDDDAADDDFDLDRDWYDHPDDDADDDGDDDDPVCQAPQSPPPGYGDGEALWLVARLGDNAPYGALYAYFWIDWFLYEECSYSSGVAVLYPRGGTPVDAGGMRPDWSIAFDAGRYGIQVGDVIVAAVDPDDAAVMTLRLRAGDWTGDLRVRRNGFQLWSQRYISWFDAELESAVFHAGDDTFTASGPATLERWNAISGLRPDEGEIDIIQGWWLYAPLSWESTGRDRASTLLWLWIGVVEGETVLVRADGAASVDGTVTPLVIDDWDFDFAENEGDGHLNRYRVEGHLTDGRTFDYEAALVNRYVDRYPEGWDVFLPDAYCESHDWVEGTLVLDGESYTGGGVQEWHVTQQNPLAE